MRQPVCLLLLLLAMLPGGVRAETANRDFRGVIVGVNVSLLRLLPGGWLFVRRRERADDEGIPGDEEPGI